MADSFNKYDVYAVAGSFYCYHDSKVLRNKFGITDDTELKKLEADITTIRQYSLLSNPVSGHFSSAHLCSIHKYLFGDIYKFAGHYRCEDIMKGTTRFLAHSDIKKKLQILLNELKQENYLNGLSKEDFIIRSAYYFSELNYIHPFREGNGRATREFMRLLFEKNGYVVNWDAVSRDELLTAMEASVFDTRLLEVVLQKCLSEK
ncbi:MAG: Fic family protein [Oscillospiraceae bacterium]|nr:Fic family protein [Oscillospiraceae bacterium]